MQKCTSLPELSIAVVTHLGHPLFEVLEWVSIPRASTAHHLAREADWKWEIRKIELFLGEILEYILKINCTILFFLQELLWMHQTEPWLTLPQALQWCRLSVRLKSDVQFMHIITWETGTSTGAASPSAIHSFSLACERVEGKMLVTRLKELFKVSKRWAQDGGS